MNVLLTNDDGIDAEGLLAAAARARGLPGVRLLVDRARTATARRWRG